MPEPQDLLALRLFVRAVLARSFSRAARASGVDVSTITRAVKRLEGDVGAKLLLRSTTGLSLTEAGRLYFEHAERVLEEDRRVRALIEAHRGAKSGTLRITMPVVVAQQVLPRATVRLLANYPSARLDVHASDDRVDVLAQAFDLAIRLGPLPSSTLRARKLFRLGRATCAAPSWIRKHGKPRHPNELEELPSLAYGNGPSNARWTFRRGAEEVEITVSPIVRSNNVELLVALAEQGLGVVRLPTWIADPIFAARRLVPLLEDWEAMKASEDLTLYAVYAEDPGKARLRDAFLDAMVESAKER